jgi:hypothetical protein
VGVEDAQFAAWRNVRFRRLSDPFRNRPHGADLLARLDIHSSFAQRFELPKDIEAGGLDVGRAIFAAPPS